MVEAEWAGFSDDGSWGRCEVCRAEASKEWPRAEWIVFKSAQFWVSAAAVVFFFSPEGQRIGGEVRVGDLQDDRLGDGLADEANCSPDMRSMSSQIAC